MSKIYNVHDAKSNLSRLIEEVLAGEEVTIARSGLPLIDLKRHAPRPKFVLGSLSHLIEYNMSDEEEKAFFAPEPWDPWSGEDSSKW
ncbi:MAG: type II toxin-antitoxin system Phd/YefM family antitoxin [Rhodoluna sp.]